jgi:hypothetical protein
VGGVRGGLLGGQQPVGQPAADGRRRHCELGGGLRDRDDLAVGVGRWGGGDAGALTGGLDARLGEWPAGAGQPSLLGQDRGDLVVGVVGGEAADQLDGVLRRAPGLGAAPAEGQH